MTKFSAEGDDADGGGDLKVLWYLLDGESDRTDVGGAHGDQGVEAMLPLTEERYALVHGEQTLDQVHHGRRDGEQMPY
jgi:hypothetical protein